MDGHLRAVGLVKILSVKQLQLWFVPHTKLFYGFILLSHKLYGLLYVCFTMSFLKLDSPLSLYGNVLKILKMLFSKFFYSFMFHWKKKKKQSYNTSRVTNNRGVVQHLVAPLVGEDISSNDVVTCEGHNGSERAKEMRNSSVCILYAVSYASGSYQQLLLRELSLISPLHNALRNTMT